MPDERGYVYEFVDGVRLRARFRQDRGSIREFMVQLEVRQERVWKPVVRFDNAHGRPHMDILNSSGRETNKLWLIGTNSEVLTSAVEDIKTNWPHYLAQFNEEGRQ